MEFVPDQARISYRFVPKKPKITKEKARTAGFLASGFTLPIAVFLLFWVFVNFDGILLAFQEQVAGPNGTLVTVFTWNQMSRAFRDLFTSDMIAPAFLNSLIFYAVAILVIFPVSLLMSYFIYKKVRWYKFFRVIVYLPTIISATALVTLYKAFFTSGGPYDALLHAMGIQLPSLFTGSQALPMLLIYNVLFTMGGNVVVICGAMNSIDPSLLEAGQIDGCSWFKEFTHIIIPVIRPTLNTMLLLSLAGFVASSGPILAMTKDISSTYTLAYLLYCLSTGAGTLSIKQDLNYASALGLSLTILTLPLVLFCNWLNNRQGD